MTLTTPPLIEFCLSFHPSNLVQKTRELPLSFSPRALLNTLQTCPSTQRIWVAYSGGLDSHVLLHALGQLRDQALLSETLEVRAIHIHHGLQLQADEWVQHCQLICQKLNISCEVVHVHAHAARRESPEAKARQARYEALMQRLGQEEVILTAHHADDQAETVLLQLLRGAGVAGLSAMPKLTRLGLGWLMRPLLAFTRAQLYDYAQKEHLHWIEDPSNADTHFDRNFLRHEVIPLLRHHWPAMSLTLGRSAQHMAQANELVTVLAQQDLSFCQGRSPDQLYLPSFLKFSVARQYHILKFWFKNLNLLPPRSVQIHAILDELIFASEDRQPVVRWSGIQVRRYHHHLFVMPNLPPSPAKNLSLLWKFPEAILLPWGSLVVHPSFGTGLRFPSTLPLCIRFRQGGETCRWRGHQREVKKLLQETHIPPWQRPFIPLIYLENTLIAIPGVGIFDGFKVSDQEPGWEIYWERV